MPGELIINKSWEGLVGKAVAQVGVRGLMLSVKFIKELSHKTAPSSQGNLFPLATLSCMFGRFPH